ncbi:uncharacterized protein LOC120640856 [Panicum virgatum]|uniref:uncharacterized protein LOC120640856 n=1 Tax=Panicum virgatum TaxID=38727 RepID=UPI0019D5B941|nr:uncharacterized protein LOC120640856 [Panicum virgatum]
MSSPLLRATTSKTLPCMAALHPSRPRVALWPFPDLQRPPPSPEIDLHLRLLHCSAAGPLPTTLGPNSRTKSFPGEPLMLPHHFPTAGEPSPRRISASNAAATPRDYINP